MTYVNPIRQGISKGNTLLAAWLFSGSSDIGEILARAGYPVVIICHEHGTGVLANLGDVLRAVRFGGAEPLLRVPSHDPNYLKRVLDAGARSLMIPLVETADEAVALVAACRYPPRGRRGYAAGVVRASSFGALPNYGAQAHEELFLAVQIESAKGVANAAAIAAVEGIDMIFVGPNDLAGDLGFFENLDQPPVHHAIDHIATIVRAAGKSLGIIPYGGRNVADLTARGFSLIATAADFALIRDGARADLSSLRTG